MYGRDPQLPVYVLIIPEPDGQYMEVGDFRDELVVAGLESSQTECLPSSKVSEVSA